MIEAAVAAFIFLAGTIFATGGIVALTRKEIGQLKLDVNRMGNKSREEEKAAARRYHNQCMVAIANENDRDTRFKIAGMLKEDS
jgi:hypothetical protein